MSENQRISSAKQSTGRPRGPMGGHGPGPGGGMHPGEKPKNFKGTIRKLFSYLAGYKYAFILVLIFSIGSTIFTIIGPDIMGDATEEIFQGLMGKVTGQRAGIDFDAIGSTLMLLLGLYVLSALLSFIQSYIMGGITQRVSYRLRKEIAAKINKLPMRFFDAVPHGEVLSRVTNDVDTLSQGLNQSMTQVISSITTLIGILIMMFSISWIMTLAALFILPLSLGLVTVIVKKSQKHFISNQKYLGHINSQVEEVYGGHNIVRMFNGEQKAMETFNQTNQVLYNSSWKSQFLSGMMMPLMTFIGNLGYVVVSVLGGWLTIKNMLTVGNIVSFTQYMRNFNQPIIQVAQIANMLQSTVAAGERVFEFLEEAQEESNADSPITVTAIEGYVQFDHVAFGYTENKTIIHDFSANIQPGQKVAIVGPTGAGKTTMVKLLMRFYDVNRGHILVDGHDIQRFDRDELRKFFGMVLQDAWLFSGSILENIRYGRLDATDQEVMEAAKAAYVHHFIQTLPGAYQMELNEETSNISQGQKQLITIARAILADPKILILDEATSSVDTRTEILIQKAMNRLMEGRTSFVIAHRLSTIRDADLILVMNNGDIVEQGKHEELLAQNGFYANLYNAQFERNQAV